MTFDEVLAQVLELLQHQGCVSYEALQRRFGLDDAYLDDLKAELIDAQRLARDEGGRLLVWRGAAGAPPTPRPVPQAPAPPAGPDPAAAERRQLTVLFCDLVESTRLASQLDPEDLREVVRAYQSTCAAVIQRFDGHIAQYLGDGLLVYFGYPQAHEDDAQRAIRTGLAIVAAMHVLNRRLEQENAIHLAVRVGIHTGLVVVGAVGSGGRQEHLALGDTPNIAARIQSLALSDMVVISAATWQLVQGYFPCQALGPQPLRGVATAIPVYQVLGESGVQSRLDVAVTRGLTPLVGREAEVALLLERWGQAKDGLGHVVLLSGEAGIGKSRLVQVVKDQIAQEPHTRLECRCSPYYQHTALYPIIDFLQRLLRFQSDEAPDAKLEKLERALSQYRLALHDSVPLFATLLSLPLPEARYAPLPLTPQRQKQKTLEALLAIVLELAERHPVLVILEDLHWVDPTTMEFLHLLLGQGPTTRLLTVVTYRPEFQPPWGWRTHLTPLALQRLSPAHVAALATQVTGGKPLPPEVLQYVVSHTDGVPLFVEELTKTVVESNVLQEIDGHYALTGPVPTMMIPTTLHDALMARLDRLSTVKAVAQLGATIGRTFAYDLLQAVTPLEAATLQQSLRQLVAAELLYQHGLPPRATYRFKHALIQEAAYQSLLRSTRQLYHQRIAQVLEAQFPERATTQPELLARHYTEAGLREQAIAYWQRAGQRAVAHSAHLEAIGHFTHGLELLEALPDTPQRAQQELTLRIALGVPLIATRGYTAPGVEHTYRRALELCQHIGDTPQLFPAMAGLFTFYLVRGELYTARQLSTRFFQLVQAARDPALVPEAHTGQGIVAYYLGDLTAAREHCEHGLTLYTISPHRSRAVLYQDPRVACLIHAAFALWSLGYRDQALTRHNEALAVAQQLAHPYTLVWTLDNAARFQQFRREAPHQTQERAEAVIAVAAEQGFPHSIACGTLLRGWAMVAQGQRAEGLAQMGQGWAAWRTIGAGLSWSYWLGLLAEAYGNAGQSEEGLALLTEALAVVDNTGQRFYAAELYRLKGELQLQHATPDAQQVEECFRQALEISRQQQAKSWELRAAVSLARLWQQQGKRQKAYDLLAQVYGWFTEGFDTADLQEARTLLEELG